MLAIRSDLYRVAMTQTQVFLKHFFNDITQTLNPYKTVPNTPQNRNKEPSCWIITEGMAGTQNQCIGVAQALGLDNAEIKKIELMQPWKTLSPYLKLEQSWSFSPSLEPPWPDLVLSSGRKSIATARYIKRQSEGKTIIAQIQDPRVNPEQFDLVAVPAHDPTRGPNVVVTTAAPNKITTERIEKERESFPQLENLKAPRVAVLIGGTSKAYCMSKNITRKLADQLSEIEASLMITCSRRTGEGNQKTLRKKLDKKGNFFWDGNGQNPYLAMLGWADIILVTADSVSMLSESCTTGKPVYMIPLEGGAPRINKLHHNLINRGALRIFEGTFETWGYEPLNDAQMVAKEIKTRFSLFNE